MIWPPLVAAVNPISNDGEWGRTVRKQFHLTYYDVGNCSCKVVLSLTAEDGLKYDRDSLVYPRGLADSATVILALAKFEPILIDYLKEVNLL